MNTLDRIIKLPWELRLIIYEFYLIDKKKAVLKELLKEVNNNCLWHQPDVEFINLILCEGTFQFNKDKKALFDTKIGTCRINYNVSSYDEVQIIINGQILTTKIYMFRNYKMISQLYT